MTETELVFRRSRLRYLMRVHPNWTGKELAQAMEMSEGWVRKWRRRLRRAAPDDREVLWSRSRRPHRIKRKVTPALEAKVLSIRDDPPEGLRRTPGCDAINYYLEKSAEVKGGELPLICPKTINRILHRHQRIAQPKVPEHTPLVRAGPMMEWEIDFKDVVTVREEATDKRMHQVETLNLIDCGTSILVANPSRLDYNAETVIVDLMAIFRRKGMPKRIRFDRDPRFVGSAQSRDYPSALVRFLRCLGVEPEVCPPQRPDKNPFVERYNRTMKYEGIFIYRPENLQQTEEMNRNLWHHYNYQRPNQAITCGNCPPCLAFPDLPTLPPLPDTIDPDAWLSSLEHQTFKRRVNASGSIKLDKHHYYVQSKLKGCYVALRIDPAERSLIVEYRQEIIKTVPLKGLVGHTLSLDDYLTLIRKEAVSEWRRYLSARPRHLPLAV